MGSFQAMPGFLLVIEGKTIAQFVPTIRHMTNTTVSGKRCVGNERPPLPVPLVSEYEETAACQKASGQGNAQDNGPDMTRSILIYMHGSPHSVYLWAGIESLMGHFFGEQQDDRPDRSPWHGIPPGETAYPVHAQIFQWPTDLSIRGNAHIGSVHPAGIALGGGPNGRHCMSWVWI